MNLTHYRFGSSVAMKTMRLSILTTIASAFRSQLVHKVAVVNGTEKGENHDKSVRESGSGEKSVEVAKKTPTIRDAQSLSARMKEVYETVARPYQNGHDVEDWLRAESA